MKAFGLLLVVLATVATAEDVLQSPVYGFHRRVGIPTATRIKAAEERGTEAGTERIVGGMVTDISEIPYQCGLLIQVLSIFISVCGASLISPNRVLTAAHCKFDGVVTAESFTIACGTNTLFTGGTRINVTVNDVVMHPQWNWNTAENDIAMMLLPYNLVFSNVIQPIDLPTDTGYEFIPTIWVARASGYGLTIDGGSFSPSQRLSSVYLQIIPNDYCQATFGPYVHESNICTLGAGGRGTCSGDSGGPLVDRRLVGVSSYWSTDGCELGQPAVFVRVTSYLPWINTLM